MKSICTHSGSFHADDALGVAILKILHPGASVLRSRDPKAWASCDALVDVGGEHDPDRNRFDHHQKGFDARRGGANGTPYAGSGLVWLAHGIDCVRAILPGIAREEAAAVAAEVDERVIKHADAVDVGIDLPGPSSFNLSGLIGSFNVTWLDDPEVSSDDDRFASAVHMCTLLIKGAIRSASADLAARSILEQAQTISNGRILVIDTPRLPFEDYVQRQMPEVLFVVYPESAGHKHQVRVVPKVPGKFEARADLPQSWAGLQGRDLASITGVDDAVFCHNGRFICGAASREGAIRLAELALDEVCACIAEGPRSRSQEGHAEAIRIAHAAGLAGTTWTVGPEELAHLLKVAREGNSKG